MDRQEFSLRHGRENISSPSLALEVLEMDPNVLLPQT